MNPWKTEKAMKELISRIPRKGIVFEWGSGGSILQMAYERPEATIYTVEDDPNWTREMALHVPENVVLLHIPDRKRYVNIAEHFAPYDLMINDGIERVKVNEYVIENRGSLLRHNGHYFLHDYESKINGQDDEWKYTNPGLENLEGTEFLTITGQPNEMGVVWQPELGGFKLL